MKRKDDFPDEDCLRIHKFFNKHHALKKQQILKKKGIKSRIVKTTKINRLFPKAEQKRSAYKVVRVV